jgi:type IV pilus assembly protein PilV
MSFTPVSALRSVLARRRARGFTMVEMLVALVVLAVGMLGVAGLFVISLRSGGTAISRMQAVNLASDMADRIRSNRRAGTAYTRTGTNHNCVGAAAVNCTPEQMAETDVFLWRQQIAAAFPGGRAAGTVEFVASATPTTPSVYTVTLAWREQGRTDAETDSQQSFTTRVESPTN